MLLDPIEKGRDILFETSVFPVARTGGEIKEDPDVEKGGEPENDLEAGFGDFVAEGALGEKPTRPASQQIEQVEAGFGDAEFFPDGSAFVPGVVQVGQEADTCEVERKGFRISTLSGLPCKPAQVGQDEEKGQKAGRPFPFLKLRADDVFCAGTTLFIGAFTIADLVSIPRARILLCEIVNMSKDFPPAFIRLDESVPLFILPSFQNAG